MNLLFKEIWIDRILNGHKTVTRRSKEPRYDVGDIVYAKTSYHARPFARLQIVRISEEIVPGAFAQHFGIDLDGEGQLEGCTNWLHFIDVYGMLHGLAGLDEPCWRIEFLVVSEDGR